VQPSTETASTKQTYTAKWVKDKFRVDFNLNYEGRWLSPLLLVSKGSLIGAPTQDISRGGYDFHGWYTDANCTTPWYFDKDKVDADVMLFAKWTKIVPPAPPQTPVGSQPPLETSPQPPVGANPTLPDVTKPTLPGSANPAPPANQASPKANPANSGKAKLSPAAAPASQGAPKQTVPKTETRSKASPQKEIDDDKAPLESVEEVTWSLINLILAVVGVIELFAIFIGKRLRRNTRAEDGDSNSEIRKDTLPFWMLAAISSLVSILLFALTENIKLDMIAVNRNTWIFALLFLATNVFALLASDSKRS
jgi:uncharacterized repeat protein (TIGR02543 family)